MKTVDRAFFVAGGAQVVTVVSNRVEAHGLDPVSDGRLRPTRLWTAKVTQCSHVTEAPRAGRIIATDTRGRHHGICARTGAVDWQVGGPGEGHAPLVVDGPGGEMFVFISWRGVMQRLDPVTGADLAPPHDFGHQVRNLHRRAGTGVLSVERLQGHGRALCRLTLDPVTLTEIMPITASFGIVLSPDGTRAIEADHYDTVPGDRATRGQTFALIDTRTGAVLATRRFAAGHFPSHEAFWSPDGAWIAIFEGDMLHLLDAETLETRGSVAAGKYRRSAFHPDGRHLCVCRAGKSEIVPLAGIVPA